MNRILTLVTVLVMLSAATALSQDFCEGDFDYDGDVDAMDALGFKSDFGRRQDGRDPCPPDGPAPVPKTGQTQCWDAEYNPGCEGTGQDGEYQKGIEWPNPRFTENEVRTVTDNLTGLIWLKDAECEYSTYGQPMNWFDALSFCNGLASGFCGLTDSSSPGDWRLPNVNELASLIDRSNKVPALPTGHPFDYVYPSFYWSSTTHAEILVDAWVVDMDDGEVNCYQKDIEYRVWCVRGGQ